MSEIPEVLDSTIKNLKSMLAENEFIGRAIEFEDTKVFPISKITMGFVSGGGEYDAKRKKIKDFPFAGGSGGGVNITPIGFLVLDGQSARFIKVENDGNLEKIIEIAKNLAGKIRGES